MRTNLKSPLTKRQVQTLRVQHAHAQQHEHKYTHISMLTSMDTVIRLCRVCTNTSARHTGQLPNDIAGKRGTGLLLQELSDSAAKSLSEFQFQTPLDGFERCVPQAVRSTKKLSVPCEKQDTADHTNAALMAGSVGHTTGAQHCGPCYDT